MQNREDFKRRAVKRLAERNPSARRLTLLFFLVLFVFAILLVSVGVAALLLFILNSFGIVEPLSSSSLPLVLGFLLVVSLLVATLLAFIAGKRTLRPFTHIINATKEIAAGNFAVRLEPRGPEEFKELAVSFNEMAEELGSIETLRDDFVHNISHEYKTPIVSIAGFAKLLKNENLPQEQHNEYADIIIAESERLAQLSANVLMLSKLDSSDTLAEVAPFSLDEQLRRAILLLDQHIEECGLEIELELAPCTIISSEELLQQVWINLLSNALKFTPRGGSIMVQLACSEEGVHVEVSDTGIGIEPEAIEHVFDKFFQADDSRSSLGNGLGLPLAHRIMELCRGTIEIQSEPGCGTRVLVTVPLAA